VAGNGRHNSPALRLQGVEVRYRERVALQVDDLTVATGEVLAVLGPNGAGKSTLLHVAALLRWPDQGDVWIVGERASPRSARRLRRRTAMVLQSALLFDVSVRSNAASGLRFRGVGRREAERRALTSLERFGVAHLAAHAARSLSGGEAQRVSLARAFAVEPELLLLDEPFANLDAPTRAALLPELAGHLREQRIAAVLVTHDEREARILADSLILLDSGRIVQRVRLRPDEPIAQRDSRRPAERQGNGQVGVDTHRSDEERANEFRNVQTPR
jgi:tungstate transport system ATP-binding protein